MLGAIIGDIVGSRFEFHNTDKYDFEMFTEETTAPGSLEEYKKNALLAEFEKNYEKASENWMQYLNETMKSNRELEDEVLERTLSCFRKTTNLQREFFMYEDLIAHYPDHPKRSEWENERNELERIIRAQEK